MQIQETIAVCANLFVDRVEEECDAVCDVEIGLSWSSLVSFDRFVVVFWFTFHVGGIY
jgi:hypothetical protein